MTGLFCDMGLKESLLRTTYMKTGVITKGGSFLDFKACCCSFGFEFHNHWVSTALPGTLCEISVPRLTGL